jgi:hypothetical protein
MSTVLLALALVSGLATVVFLLNGLRLAFVRHQRIGGRALLLTTLLSVVTMGFTVWQLVLLLQV